MVRVLVVDDEIHILSSLRDRVLFDKDKKLELIRFGIDICKLPQNQDIFEEIIAEKFIKFVKKEGLSDFDILLLDFAIPNKSGNEILEELKEEILPPVIIMSADDNAIHNEILSLLESAKAKRYIYKNSPFFPDELKIFSRSLVEEYRNQEVIKLLEVLAKKRDKFHSFDKFAKELAKELMARLPDTFVIIRKYDEKREVLKKTHDVEGLKIPEEISKNYDKRLFLSLEKEDGYNIDNEFKLAKFPELKGKLGDKIRFLTIRIGDKEKPIGVINISKKITHFPFNKYFSKTMKFDVDLLSSNITLIEQNEIFNGLLKFLSGIMSKDNESEILNEYVNIVHKLFNEDDSENKTTIKLINPESNELSLYCQGKCDLKRTEFSPKITDRYISSTVFMTNISILIYDTTNLDEAWERFKKVHKKIYGFEMDDNKKFAYYNTAEKEMKSELCIPISHFDEEKKGGIVFGVLNLESYKKNSYSIKQLKLLYIASQIVASRLEFLRNQKLLEGLLDNMVKLKTDKKIEHIVNLLKSYLGFYSLMIFKKGKMTREGNLNLEYIKIEDNEINSVEVKREYDDILKNEEKFKKTALHFAEDIFKNGYDIFYIPEIPEVEDISYYMLGKFENKKLKTKTLDNENGVLTFYHQKFYRVNSYYAQAIKYKNNFLGMLVIEFKISNPMINYNISMIEKVTKLLGIIYLQKEGKISDEIVNLYIQEHLRRFHSNFRHSAISRYKKIEDELNQKENKKIKDIFDEIINITYYHDKVIESKNYKEIVDIIIKELSIKEKKIDIKENVENFNVFENQREFLYMIFFHLLDNAREVLKEKKDPKIAIKSYIKNNLLYIEVYDNGKLPNNPDKIFDKGYSEKHYKGGFGLSHIKEIVSKRGGEIRFIKNHKYFIITLPFEVIGNKIGDRK